MKAIKKPIPVDVWQAVEKKQFNGKTFIVIEGADPDEVKQLVAEGYKSIGNQKDLHFEVETLEGTMRGEVDDYLVRGVQGELYVIKKDIFEQTYDVIG